MKHSKVLLLLLLLIGMATLAYGQVDCLTFDGIDQYVGFGDILDMGLNNWSHQIWFKTTSENAGIMGKSVYASHAGRWGVYFLGNTLKTKFQGNAVPTNNITLDAVPQAGNINWNDGEWHNVTVTINRLGLMTLYMDGVYNTSVSIANQATINMNNSAQFYIGAYGNTIDGTTPDNRMYLDGSVREARIWDRVLTPAEIAANWDKQISYPQDNLIGYWRINEGSGRILNDLSGSNNTGNLINNPTWTTDGPPTLPVELSSFTATISTHNNVVLTWVTQSETSVMGFYVYRSTDSNLANAQQISSLIDATNTSDQQVYRYTDSEINQIGTYYYWLMVSDMNGSESFHGPINVTYENTQPGIPNIPVFTELKQVYPNPFNPNTNISYVLATPSDVSITIYNSRGQEVRSFEKSNVAAGTWNLSWDGKDQNGTGLASGVYYIRMLAGQDSFMKKAVLMK